MVDISAMNNNENEHVEVRVQLQSIKCAECGEELDLKLSDFELKKSEDNEYPIEGTTIKICKKCGKGYLIAQPFRLSDIALLKSIFQ